MKKLEIVVRSEKLDDVKAILDECESTGAMVSNIMGYGNQKGYKTTYRGSEYVVNLIPKVKIETIAADDVADKIIFKVCERISTGKIGDGKIFVYDVADYDQPAVFIYAKQRAKACAYMMLWRLP